MSSASGLKGSEGSTRCSSSKKSESRCDGIDRIEAYDTERLAPAPSNSVVPDFIQCLLWRRDAPPPSNKESRSGQSVLVTNVEVSTGYGRDHLK